MRPVDLSVEELDQPPVGVEAGAEAQEAAQAHEPGKLDRGEDIYREVQQDWHIPKTYEIPLNHLLTPFQAASKCFKNLYCKKGPLEIRKSSPDRSIFRALSYWIDD